MKKTLLLKTMLLLCAFIVGSSSAWADENVSTVSTKFSATGDVTGKITQTGDFKTASWNLDVTWKDANNPYWGDLNSTKGSQIGSGSKPATGVVLTGSNIPGTIISVKVNTSVASGGTTTVGVSVGNAAFSYNDEATATLATAATDYEFTGSGSGDVVLTWSQPSTSKAIYIKSVTITYTTGSIPPTISASDVPIVYDATAGSIAYTINNEPTPVGTLTAAIKDGTTPTIESFVLGTATGSAVPFTCAANLTATARTTTVTLTYTYDTDKTATKDVTITQAADPNAFNNITDIIANNTSYKVKGTVVATNAKGFVIGDGTGYVYTYLNAAPSQSVGDKLSITGTTGTYGHILQFTSSATIAEASTSNYDGTPAVTVLDAEGIAAYNSDYQLSDYVQFEGVLVKNSNNYEITVGTGSSTATTRISYPTTAQATALDALLNKTVRVKGYFAGFSSSIFTVMLESVEEVIVDAHTLTVSATNGSVEITGKTLVGGQCEVAEGAEVTATATANDGYRFVNWTVTGAGSSVSDATDNPTTFTMGTEDAIITANFEAIPTHTVTWSINGTETAEDIMEGEDITFPADPADVGGKTFMGWTETAIAGTTDEKPTFVNSATMGTSDLKYYAVYANVNGTPSSLTKMSSDETFTNGDKVVIVAYDTAAEKYYAIYQETQSSSWVAKYEFDGDAETVAADDKNWLTVTASSTNWILGDETNGYLYSSGSNNLNISTENSTAFTLAYSTDKGFTLKYGSRWMSLRTDTDNNTFRLGGTGSNPLGVGYFDIYKYVAGNGSYSGYCTSITVPVTISDAGYATFSNASAVDFSSNAGLSVYYVSSTAENKAEMVEIGSKKVPANTGVLLKGAAGNYSGAVTAGVDALVGNLLFACVDGYDATVDNEIYILANGTSGVGFYPIKGGTSLGAGKAYIGGSDVNAKCLTLSFGSETTAINGVEEVAPANVKTRKVVKNGRLVIETANGEFTIDGARVK